MGISGCKGSTTRICTSAFFEELQDFAPAEELKLLCWLITGSGITLGDPAAPRSLPALLSKGQEGLQGGRCWIRALQALPGLSLPTPQLSLPYSRWNPTFLDQLEGSSLVVMVWAEKGQK